MFENRKLQIKSDNMANNNVYIYKSSKIRDKMAVFNKKPFRIT